MDQEAWDRLLGPVLEGEAEFGPAWEQLEAALDAAPHDVHLLRWRSRLAEDVGLLHDQIDALRRLVAIDAGDREARLALALTQHRRAFRLVDDALDEDAQQAETERLEAEAEGWFDALLAEQVGDGDFMARIFGGDDGPLQCRPWVRLWRLLQAAAASPHHAGLQRALALAWCDLAGSAPAQAEDDEQLPMGFMADGFGNWFEPLMIERALAALAPLLDADPHDIELLQQRAALQAACGRYPAASADHAVIARAWRIRAASAADDETRDQALQCAEEASQQSATCTRGRAAVVQATLGGFEEAIGRLGQFGRAAERADLSDAAREMLAEMAEQSAQRRAELQHDFDTNLRPAVVAWLDGPDAATRAALDETARVIAASSHGLLALDPVRVRALQQADLEAPLDDWFVETDEQLRAAGWRHIGWSENPAFSTMFGCQVVTGLWCDAAGTSLAAASVAGALRVIDLQSEFADGRQMITTASRGRSNYGGGPAIDQLAVDADVPLAELAALHVARVALRCAQQPAVPALVVDSVPAFEAMEERQRQAKLAFRLAEGISEYEAMGMPTDHPDYFVPMVREAVRAELRRVAAGRGDDGLKCERPGVARPSF